MGVHDGDGGVKKWGNRGACGVFNMEVGQEYFLFWLGAPSHRGAWLLMPINYKIFNTHT